MVRAVCIDSDDDVDYERRAVVAKFVINSAVAGLLCVLGFVGNCFSFAVLNRDTTAPLASFLLRVLAVTDNLFLVLWFVNFSLNDALALFDVQFTRNSWAWRQTQVGFNMCCYLSESFLCLMASFHGLHARVICSRPNEVSVKPAKACHRATKIL